MTRQILSLDSVIGSKITDQALLQQAVLVPVLEVLLDRS